MKILNFEDVRGYTFNQNKFQRISKYPSTNCDPLADTHYINRQYFKLVHNQLIAKRHQWGLCLFGIFMLVRSTCLKRKIRCSYWNLVPYIILHIPWHVFPNICYIKHHLCCNRLHVIEHQHSYLTHRVGMGEFIISILALKTGIHCCTCSYHTLTKHPHTWNPISAYISNCICYKVLDGITYLFPNFNGAVSCVSEQIYIFMLNVIIKV